MESDAPEQNNPRRRVRRKVVKGLIIVLACFLVYRVTVSCLLHAKLSAIRAAGHPVTLEELDAWYREPPPDEDATGVLLAAMDAYIEPTPEELVHLPFLHGTDSVRPWEEFQDEERDAIKAVLDKNRGALDLVYQGARLGRARWPLDLTQGLHVEFTHLAPLRELGRLLELDAVHRADRGDAEGARLAVEALAGLSGCMGDEPTLISQLARQMFVLRAIYVAEQVVRRVYLDSWQLSHLARALDATNGGRAMERGIIGERCLNVDGTGWGILERLEGMRQYDASGWKYALLLVYRPLGIRELDCLLYLRGIDEVIDVLRMPVDERHVATARWPRTVPELGVGGTATWYVLPLVRAATLNDLRTVAAVRTAVGAMDVLRRYQLHGEIPDPADVEALDLPIDPFTGEPLKFKRLEDGFVVYSVNGDGDDDGGEPDPAAIWWSDGDVGFRVSGLGE